jgi:Zn-finger nucleic acid-binding protein
MVFRDTHWPCPRCGTALEGHDASHYRLMRCQGCRGAFVDPPTMARMVQDIEGATVDAMRVPVERALACPYCRQAMARSGIRTEDGMIEVDACAAHGQWFDARELQVALETVGLAGLAQRR